jgi:hypothetical protein
MATALKVLGQSAPSALTLTTLYTVPALTSAVVSSLVVCNTASTGTSFRISVRVGGAADTPKQYLYYDVDIAGKASFAATLGLGLSAGDIISVYATAATLSFSALGQETT